MKNERPNKGKGGRVWNHSESFRVQLALEYLDGDYSYPQIETVLYYDKFTFQKTC
jgi:hypothetical protein